MIRETRLNKHITITETPIYTNPFILIATTHAETYREGVEKDSQEEYNEEEHKEA